MTRDENEKFSTTPLQRDLNALNGRRRLKQIVRVNIISTFGSIRARVAMILFYACVTLYA